MVCAMLTYMEYLRKTIVKILNHGNGIRICTMKSVGHMKQILENRIKSGMGTLFKVVSA